MAHLGNTFSAASDFVTMADRVFMADLGSLNSSGVTGTVIASYIQEDDGSGYINIAVSAQGLTPGQHLQHIHGTFDSSGNPTNAMSPTLANDSDGDGYIEVLEGVPAYGDVLMPVDDADGNAPAADADGNLRFVMNYEIDDASNFFSPVTSTQYSFEDIMRLGLREYVIHGMDADAGRGAGTGGEVDGSGGFTAILPAASGEFVRVTRAQAQETIDAIQENSGESVRLTLDDDSYTGTIGNDFVRALAGDDIVDGAGGDDRLQGGAGDDMLSGSDGDDQLLGHQGNDSLYGGNGNDVARGRKGADLLVGGDGDDMLSGNTGRDIFGGGAGNDMLRGGGGADEFHFDAGTGTDLIADFTQGLDVISLLDGGAIDFANSVEDGARRGDSDLSVDDFDLVGGVRMMDGDNDQQVIYSSAGFRNLMTAEGDMVEAYVAASNGTNTRLVYDADWSTADGREIMAVLADFNASMTAADFDVY